MNVKQFIGAIRMNYTRIDHITVSEPVAIRLAHWYFGRSLWHQLHGYDAEDVHKFVERGTVIIHHVRVNFNHLQQTDEFHMKCLAPYSVKGVVTD